MLDAAVVVVVVVVVAVAAANHRLQVFLRRYGKLIPSGFSGLFFPNNKFRMTNAELSNGHSEFSLRSSEFSLRSSEFSPTQWIASHAPAEPPKTR
jgi:hypothetical protein